MVTSSITEDHGPVCHSHGIRGFGNTRPGGIVFVGTAPGHDEIEGGKPFVGPSGKLKNATLQSVGIDPAETYATNVLCWWKNDPTDEDIAACAPRLFQEVLALKPRVIVAMGNPAIQTINNVEKASTVRGACVWSEFFNCWVISTFHPAAILRGQVDFIADLYRDLAKINYIIDKPKDFGNVEWTLCSDVGSAQIAIEELYAKCPLNAVGTFLANDIETIPGPLDAEGKKTWTDKLRCVGISDGDTTYVFARGIAEQCIWPSDARWTFHNGMFDTQVMAKSAIYLPVVEDTLCMSYSLDERGGGSDKAGDEGVKTKELGVGIHGLKRLSREYCGAGHYEIDTWSCTDEELYEYNAHDAAYTARLAKYLYSLQLKDGRIREFYETMLVPGANALGPIRDEGVTVNRRGLRDLGIEYAEEWIELEKWLVEMAANEGWPGNINPGSSQQLKKFLNNYLHVSPPVSNAQEDTLTPYAARYEWIQKYQRWKKLEKHLSTYVTGVERALDSLNRIHPDPLIHGTRNGRLAYRRPPVQTFPQAYNAGPDFVRLRNVISADEGDVLIEADFVTGEIWSAGLWSGDPQMLADLESGDFHSAASESMFKTQRSLWTPGEWKKKRNDSKYVTFGIAYGRGAKSLHEAELAAYTMRECEEFIVNWHGRYQVHNDKCKSEIRYIFQTGEQELPSGRKRRYFIPELLGPHAINQTLNYQPAGISHDHLFLALIELSKILPERKLGRILFEVHDSILFSIHPWALEEAFWLVKKHMEMARWYDRGIPVEVKIGPTWGAAKGPKEFDGPDGTKVTETPEEQIKRVVAELAVAA